MTRKTTVLMNLALTVDLVACFHQQYLQQTDPDANPSRSIAHIIFLHNTHQTTPVIISRFNRVKLSKLKTSSRLLNNTFVPAKMPLLYVTSD